MTTWVVQFFSVHDLSFCQMYSFPFWNFLSLRRRTHSFSSLVRLPPQKTANRQSANPAKLEKKNSPSFLQLHRRMVSFLPTMNGRFLYGKCKWTKNHPMDPLGFPCQLYSYKPNGPWPTSNQTRPPWWPFHRRRPAPWYWHMHMLASGRLNFWRQGSLGLREIASLGRKEGRGGVFWWKIFFCWETKMCLFF